MKSPTLILFLLLSLSACSNARSYVRFNVLPDIDYPVYKQRTVMDPSGNIIKLTFLGCSRALDKSINAHILWEMKRKVSKKYKIAFLEGIVDGAYFIKTVNDIRIPVTQIIRGPVIPSVRYVQQGDCGLVTLNFPKFDPDKISPFDLVEGGRTSTINREAYNNYIRDPVRWHFIGCIAGKRGGR